jgi:hypothetical protein
MKTPKTLYLENGIMTENDIPNALLEEIRNEAIKQYRAELKDELEAQIGYINSATRPDNWTEEYQIGYLDGIRQALSGFTCNHDNFNDYFNRCPDCGYEPEV